MTERRRSPAESESDRATSTPPSAVADLTCQITYPRLALLECGCVDYCRCWEKAHPSERRVEAYAAAVAHLRDCGLTAALLWPEARALRERGGNDRQLVESVLRWWAA